MYRWNRLCSRGRIGYRYRHSYNTFKKHVSRTEYRKSGRLTVPTVYEGFRRGPPLRSSVWLGERQSQKRRKTDSIMSGRYLSASDVCNERLDRLSRAWNYNLQAARIHVCCKIFRIFFRKALRCSRDYEIAHLEGSFLEGLHESVRFTRITYWGGHRDGNLCSVARCSTYLCKLKERRNSTSALIRNIRCYQHKLRAPGTRVENTPILSIN